VNFAVALCDSRQLQGPYPMGINRSMPAANDSSESGQQPVLTSAAMGKKRIFPMLHKAKRTAKGVGSLLRKTGIEWVAIDPFRQSAVIAYYSIFALPALLVIIITTAGAIFGADAIDGKIHGQVSQTMGRETADQVRDMLIKATTAKTSMWATVLGLITIMVGSIGVFIELQKTLNIIWDVKAAPRKGIWNFVRARVFSFGLILSIAFLLIVSLVMSTLLAAASELFKAESSAVLVFVFRVVNFVVSLGVLSMLFALMFRFLPDAKIGWRHVWAGALLTGILFTLGKMGLAFYFTTANPGSGYGAAGSVVLIMLWTSYSSMILFLGAGFTRAYAEQCMVKVVASETGEKTHRPKEE